jgi:uncharacterized protein YeaO (DUF488 family)
MVQIKRAYEAAARSDGYRILVDDLARRAATRRVTLVYGARDERHDDAVVIRNELERRLRARTARSARRGAA